MRERRDHQRRDTNERESRKERVKRSEQFGGGRLQRIDGAHSAENHRRVEQRIDPSQMRDEVISENADAKGDADHDKSEQQVTPDAPDEFCAA